MVSRPKPRTTQRFSRIDVGICPGCCLIVATWRELHACAEEVPLLRHRLAPIQSHGRPYLRAFLFAGPLSKCASASNAAYL
jgi:hypothetical protein